MKKIKLPLPLILVLAIVIGTLSGTFLPETAVRFVYTLSEIYASFLGFFIPLMIIAFVSNGIADLEIGKAGKLLLVTCVIAYCSSFVAGSAAFFTADKLYPFILGGSSSVMAGMETGTSLEPLFTVSMPPFFDVLSAVVFAFMLGLGASSLSAKGKGETLRNVMKDFSSVIERSLSRFVIPLLPVYVIGTFASIAYEGESTVIFKSMWKAYIMMIVLHLIYIIVFYTIACLITRKNIFTMLKNELPAYATALGTQSSAASIPVNLKCAEKNGISGEISAFVIPLGANIHMPGSMISIVSIAMAAMMMFSMEYNAQMFMAFIAVMGVVTIASPGAPGGSVMSALPFIGILGLSSTGPIASLLIVLYIAQDSFGTACNVACDTALALMIDKVSSAIRN
ncbi:MAG: dicarboxylate/amino acid:cation symporter [Bullifex sp.]